MPSPVALADKEDRQVRTIINLVALEVRVAMAPAQCSSTAGMHAW
jgi:hypothetical protein